ncbi:hypothetical protein GCM10027446_08220 [Angustibacter peucedani]
MSRLRLGRLRQLRRVRQSGDGGWLSIEFVGMSFLFVFTVMLALQVVCFTYSIAQVNGAARAAARAATLGQSASAAAEDAVSPSLHPVTTAVPGAPNGQKWAVTVSVPKVIPRMPQWTITRTASMPSTEPFGG